MRFIGYEDIQSKKTNKRFVILHSVDDIEIGRGLGEKTQSDFISPDIVKSVKINSSISTDNI